MPPGDGATSKLTCNLKLYVLEAPGKKEKGDFGELFVKIWLSPDAGDKGATLTPGRSAGPPSVSVLPRCTTFINHASSS